MSLQQYKEPITPGVCRLCKCTDQDCLLCIRRTGYPCSWVNDEHTFCSSCLSENKNQRFLEFLCIKYDDVPFDSALWYELQWVDRYLVRSIHERINNKIDFYYDAPYK